jgi:hypothetical protein
LENAGVAGLIIWCIYRLVDKWAPKFLEAQQHSAQAMDALAVAFREGREEQRDILIAVRLLAKQQEEMKDFLVELDRKLGAK